MKTKKYYAIRKGRKTGIFDTWDETKKHVIGFKGAEYKSFESYEMAQNYIYNDDKSIIDEKLKDDELIAYVDGSYNISSQKFGYGIVLISNRDEIKLKKSFYDETLSNQRNVAGEVYGSMKAIEYAIQNNISKIYIHFDYMGIKSWAEGEWKTNIPLTKEYKKFIDEAKNYIEIIFIKVKAHSNDKYNDMADKLAKEAVGIL